MRKRFILAMFVASAMPGRAFAAETCETVRERTVTPIPAQRRQGDLPVCGSVAVATVLDQQYCARNAENPRCRAGEPIFSALHIAALSNDRFTNGVLPLDIVAHISGKTVALESCAPFASLSMRGQGGGSESGLRTLETLRRIWQIMPVEDNQPCVNCQRTSEHLRRVMNLSTSAAEISLALAAQTEREFFERSIVPRRCLTDGIRVPELNVVTPFFRGYGALSRLGLGRIGYDAGVSNTIVEEINRNRSLVFTIKSSNPNPTAGHAVAVLGYRTKCCASENPSQNRCFDQYLIRDSDTTFGPPGDHWINQTEMLDRSRRLLGGTCSGGDDDGQARQVFCSLTGIVWP